MRFFYRSEYQKQILMLGAISILFFIYASYIILNVVRTNQRRRSLKVGDVCNVYLGESKFTGFVMKVNTEVDVWVLNKVIRFSKNQIYA